MKKITLMLFAMLFGIAANAQESINIFATIRQSTQENNHIQTSATLNLSGNGTQISPFLISTPDDLTELASFVNGYNSTSGMYFQLTNNIDMSSMVNFTPIGYFNGEYFGPFSGVFDGNNFVISNLTITDSFMVAGLFGAISGTPSSISKVKNLGIENVSVTGSFCAGGLVGYIYQYTEIDSCYTIIGQGGITALYAGGLVGGAESVSNSTIKECYSTGGTISGQGFVGGIIGTLYGNGHMTNCYSTNNVIGNNYVGGFIGGYAESDNTISNCYASGNVTYSTSAGGGFSGNSTGSCSITNCYYRENNIINGIVLSGVTPMLAADMQTDQFATTLNASQNPAPWLRSASINDGYPYLFGHPTIIGTGTLVDPYIVQNNSNLNTVANRVNGGQQDAFIAFYNDSIINGTNNSSIGNSSYPFTGKVVFIDGAGNRVENGKVTIDGITNPLFGNINLATINNISLTGVNINTPSSDNVGALVSIANNTVIDSCFASGTITGGNNVGGLIGNGNSCSNIINCHSTAVVIGNTYVGGLVGYMDGCSVQKCYATGNVSANNFAGGLLGSNVHGTTLKSYSRGNVIRLTGTGNLFGSLVGTGSGNEVGCFYLNSATTPSDAMSNYRGTASANPEDALN